MDGSGQRGSGAAAIGKLVQQLEKEKDKWVWVGNVHVDALWEALKMKAPSPEKFMDVSEDDEGVRPC